MKRLVWVTVGLGLGTMTLAVAANLVGLHINTSRSAPRGLYIVEHRTKERPPAVLRGDYVLVCPPPRPVFEEARRRGYIGPGVCPGAYGHLIKRVRGLASDLVDIDDVGVRVNGELLAHSRPRVKDVQGRLLTILRIRGHRLDNAHVLLMSDVSDTSFDGRYFGPIDRAQLRGVLRPLAIWE